MEVNFINEIEDIKLRGFNSIKLNLDAKVG
jgi:hypothetical protein